MMKRPGTSSLLGAAFGGLAALLAPACGSPPPTIPPPAATPLPAAAPPPASASTATPAPSPRPPANPYEGTLSPLTYPGERHLANVRQLTFGAENAEAYWSPDGKRLIFQSSRPPYECDQIYIMDPDDPAGSTHLVSNGQGRTTCSYFFPDGKRILYASTHLGAKRCPTPPDMSQGYVWGLFADYDIFTANVDGSDVKRITTTPGYDAEATISMDGRSIVFTSARDGDLELYAMAPDGSNVRRLTNAVGYDGGAFYSDDGEWLVYRASHPTEPAAIADFKALLSRSLIRPKTLDLHIMRADGTGDWQVTDNNAANFAPFFFRGGHDRIIFCSNLADPKGRNFDLFAVNADGTDLERITFNPTFDGFPMFSPDGKRLAFCSNRHNGKSGETNVFVADWVP